MGLFVPYRNGVPGTTTTYGHEKKICAANCGIAATDGEHDMSGASTVYMTGCSTAWHDKRRSVTGNKDEAKKGEKNDLH